MKSDKTLWEDRECAKCGSKDYERGRTYSKIYNNKTKKTRWHAAEAIAKQGGF